MRKRAWMIVVLSCGASVGGCADSVPVGKQGAELGASGEPAPDTCPVAPEYEPPVDWQGYVEGGSRPDGLRLRMPTDDQPGFVLLGRGPALEPASDPNVGYPTCPRPLSTVVDGAKLIDPLPGFEYTMRKFERDGARVRFFIELGEAYDGWCMLQTPVPTVPGPSPQRAEAELAFPYSCLPGANAGEFGGRFGQTCTYQTLNLSGDVVETTQAECRKVELCATEHVCDCTAQSCRAGALYDIRFDFRVDADTGEAQGTIVGLNGSGTVLRLEAVH